MAICIVHLMCWYKQLPHCLIRQNLPHELDLLPMGFGDIIVGKLILQIYGLYQFEDMSSPWKDLLLF